MIYRIAADAVLLLHLAFILFVVFGGWVVLRKPIFIWAHLPAATWGAFIEFSGRVCPLTPLEYQLRIASGSAGYSGGFIERYLIPVVYPSGLNDSVQIALGLVVVLVNAVFYGLLVKRWARTRRDT
jgi:hypothetical protein